MNNMSPNLYPYYQNNIGGHSYQDNSSNNGTYKANGAPNDSSATDNVKEYLSICLLIEIDHILIKNTN
jgi:hypothetical protein